jgi:hypothetical protein
MRQRWRACLVALVAVLGFSGGVVLVASAGSVSAAGSGRVIIQPCLNQRADANGGSTLVGCIPYNTTITIDCVKYGTSVTGPYGATTLWDHTTWGSGGYVSDAYIYTGTNGAVAPVCGQQPPPQPPPPAPTKAARAVSWALSMVGTTNSYNGLCELFVENAYGTASNYHTARLDYQAQKAAGRISMSTNIPAGALVFFDNKTAGVNGHVEIAVGDGTFITSDAPVKRVNLKWGGTFLGWSPAPDSWPGR